MTNTSQTNFETIRNHYNTVFNVLEKVMAIFDVDFYLIGAQSRDVWTNHLTIDRRVTRDIDFAVYIAKEQDWKALCLYLTQKENFVRDEELPYRFYYGDSIMDLIPFGGIEKNGEVIISDPEMELSVFGCMEVTQEAIIVSGKYKVISLAGLCIMKLIAYDEKPALRTKDWDDFIFLLLNYSEIAGEKLFEGSYDDLITEDFDFRVASARMLGRNLQTIVNKQEKLKNRIVEMLTSKLQKFSIADIDEMFAVREHDDDQIFIFKLISEVVKGLSDNNS